MAKIQIYQVLTRLFGNDVHPCESYGSIERNGCGKMEHFTPTALQRIASLGMTHVWYTGIIRHATQTDYSKWGMPADNPSIMKGKAGSPYAIKDYYDVDPDLAVDPGKRMCEFEALVQRTHEAGLKVIIDFVPNHVARSYKSLMKPDGVKDLGEDDDTSQAFSPQNNFYYIPGQAVDLPKCIKSAHVPDYEEFPARATGNDVFHNHPSQFDWYETIKLNYGVDYNNNRAQHFDPLPSTWTKMRDILLFWAAKGVDGFRCDMAEMVPCAFWGWVIPQVKEQYSGIIFIAEVYNPSEYRNYLHNGHFDYLYDKVGLYDTLRSVVCGHAGVTAITETWRGVQDIRHRMLNFLENHDEQRIASSFFAGDPEKAKPALVVSACMTDNPFMLYFGQELGERGMDVEGFSGMDGRTTIFDYWSVDTVRRWVHKGKFSVSKLTKKEKELRDYYKTILQLNQREGILQGEGFFDLMYVNPYSEYFDNNKEYAFLRYAGKHVVLVVANFSDGMLHTKVNIPAHAFECMKISPAQGQVKAKELISGEQLMVTFSPNAPLDILVPAYGAVMVKI